MVPQSPGLWLLAVRRGHQHAAELRAAELSRGGSRGGSHPEREGQSGDRLLPPHSPAADDAGPGAAADHEQRGPAEQAQHPGADPRPQPPLLLHCDRLPEERAGGADAHEPAPAQMDGRLAAEVLRRRHLHERQDARQDRQALRGLQQAGAGGRGEDGRRGGRAERGQDRSQATSPGRCARAHGRQHFAVLGHDARHHRVLDYLPGYPLSSSSS
mmetsp:Transcript_3158/g.12679  ORF Transcript_3158/g.12679 Transcript_3158/m.12679 type:complete len:214 (-) Transcript_3158:204-845(-)